MKRFIITFLIVISSIGVIYPKDDNGYISETIYFEIDSGKQKLEGTLTVPSNFKSGDTVVVLVSSPQSIDRDAFGLYSSLADTLSKCGIAVLRYDNRVYSADKGQKTAVYENTTKKIQMDDVRSAVLFLKKDKRFSLSPIGLIGHSEGGSVCARYSAEKQDVSFVVLLSSSAVDGCEFQYYASSVLQLPENQKELKINNDRYFCAAFHKYENIDSVRIHSVPFLISQWKLWKDAGAFGSRGKDSLSFCNEMLETYTSIHSMDLFRDNPQMYIPRIKCPVLAVYGSLDEKYDVPLNMDKMKQYLLDGGNMYSKVVCIKNMSHIFETINEGFQKALQAQISIQRSKKYKYPAPVKVWGKVVDWIKNTGDTAENEDLSEQTVADSTVVLLQEQLNNISSCVVSRENKHQKAYFDENGVYYILEQQPRFPGGNDALESYISANLRYPDTKEKIRGVVVIRFIVRETGKVDNLEVMRSLHPDFDKEAIKLIQSMQDWKPGMQDGKEVSAYYFLTVNFKK